MRNRITTRHCRIALRSSRHCERRGFTVMELMVVLAIMAILASMAAPSLRRSIQQGHADLAGANLRAIWCAERIYWLENRTYADSLIELEREGLLDTQVSELSGEYAYAVTLADESSLTVTATRQGSKSWSGRFVIDETGRLTGAVSARGETSLVPGFQ